MAVFGRVTAGCRPADRRTSDLRMSDLRMSDWCPGWLGTDTSPPPREHEVVCATGRRRGGSEGGCAALEEARRCPSLSRCSPIIPRPQPAQPLPRADDAPRTPLPTPTTAEVGQTAGRSFPPQPAAGAEGARRRRLPSGKERQPLPVEGACRAARERQSRDTDPETNSTPQAISTSRRQTQHPFPHRRPRTALVSAPGQTPIHHEHPRSPRLDPHA